MQQRTQPATERGRAERRECERPAAKWQRRSPRADDHAGHDDERGDHAEGTPNERRHGCGHHHEETERIRVEQGRPLERPPAEDEAAPTDEPDERREREAQRRVQHDGEEDGGAHGAA